MKTVIKSGKFINYLVGFLAGAITVFIFFSTYYEKKYGLENDNLQIIKAFMLPRYGFDKFKDGIDVVELRFVLRNFGHESIHVTSASTKIINSKNILHKSVGGGNNYLAIKPEESDSIIINPGDSKEIIIALGFYLPGMLDYLKSEKFKNTFYSNVGLRHMIHDLKLIDDLNQKMTELYGKDAGVEIKFYTNYKKLIRSHKINFTTVTKMFDSPGRLQQEYFIGGVLSMLYGKKTY